MERQDMLKFQIFNSETLILQSSPKKIFLLGITSKSDMILKYKMVDSLSLLLKGKNEKYYFTHIQDEKIYMVPELCLMTGIPDDFDEFRRKKIS